MPEQVIIDDISVPILLEYSRLERDQKRVQFSKTFPKISAMFPDFLKDCKLSETRIQKLNPVLQELFSNIILRLFPIFPTDLSKISICLKTLLTLIWLTFLKNKTLQESFEIFKKNLLAHTLDKLHLHKKVLSFVDVNLIFDVFFDLFFHKFQFFSHAFSKLTQIELTTIEPLELKLPQFGPIIKATIEAPENYAFLNEYDMNYQSNSSSTLNEINPEQMRLYLSGNSDFPVVTKIQLRQQYLDQIRQEKIEKKLDQEKKLVETEFREKMLAVRVK